MRQAYDYWQDQPGNYFPSLHPRGCNCLILVGKPRSQSGVHHLKVERSECDPVKFSSFAALLTTLSQLSNHLVPRSHKFQAHFNLSQKQQKSWPSKRTTNDQQYQYRHRTVKADSQVIKCSRFSYQQVIHILQQCEHHRVRDLNRSEKHKHISITWLNPSQASIS